MSALDEFIKSIFYISEICVPKLWYHGRRYSAVNDVCASQIRKGTGPLPQIDRKLHPNHNHNHYLTAAYTLRD